MIMFEDYQPVIPKILPYYHKYIFQNKSLFKILFVKQSVIFCDGSSSSLHFMSIQTDKKIIAENSRLSPTV